MFRRVPNTPPRHTGPPGAFTPRGRAASGGTYGAWSNGKLNLISDLSIRMDKLTRAQVIRHEKVLAKQMTALVTMPTVLGI